MMRSKLQQRLRSAPTFRLSSSFPNLRRKASNSWSAVQDTYLSTKQIFERHRVVFTISTSVASLLTAWAGYSLRYHHQVKVEKRLNLIEETVSMVPFHSTLEYCMTVLVSISSYSHQGTLNSSPLWKKVMKINSDVRHEELKRIVNSGGVSMTACLATAWTTLVIGYGLGWRGGSWFAHRRFQRAQLKLKEQNKPGRWQLLKKSLSRPRLLRASLEAGGSPGSSERNNPGAVSSRRVN